MWPNASMTWKIRYTLSDLVRAFMPAYMNEMDGREVKT